MQARASPRGLELLYQSAPPCPEQAYPRLQRAHTTATPFCLPEPPRPRLQLPPPRSELHRDSDSVDSYKSDGSANNYKPIKKTTPNHYVDMAQTIKEIAVNKEKAAMVRRHTTEYRGPSAPLTLPVPSPAHVRPYPYLVLTEQRYTKKKSEDNGIKLKMRPDEWKDDRQPPPRVECQTVDRRSTKKHARATKMKRQGSFNIDPSGEFHLSLDTQQKDMSRSARSCNPRSPLMDARPPPLQISAEDMVQMANCGARNKNGSLCHFISADPPSSSEAELALPRKFRTMERRKKSTPSLVSESSEETLRRDGARRRAGKPRVKETARVKEGARRGYLPLEEEACKCLVISSHSLAKASREELGVEESFDF